MVNATFKKKMQIKKQADFPLLQEYSKVFNINEKTIFAYDDIIFSNNPLSPDLLVHEERHLAQQKRYGLDTWVKNFLEDPRYRLEMELDAYKKQLESIKDRNFRDAIRRESAKNLSSSLYGEIISYSEAFTLLKV